MEHGYHLGKSLLYYEIFKVTIRKGEKFFHYVRRGFSFSKRISCGSIFCGHLGDFKIITFLKVKDYFFVYLMYGKLSWRYIINV